MPDSKGVGDPDLDPHISCCVPACKVDLDMCKRYGYSTNYRSSYQPAVEILLLICLSFLLLKNMRFDSK